MNAGKLQEALTEFETAVSIDPSSFIAVQEVNRVRKILEQNQNPPPATATPQSALHKRMEQASGPVDLSPISDTPILYLYDQIRLCMLFNLNGAAITFCGILVEYALKYTTYAKENPAQTSTQLLGRHLKKLPWFLLSSVRGKRV